jgi:diaminohydroxyphosphoribosylaminopyrimidine deaminase/5-amino-6-(5-phosphoribosylamino)uracil reductase
MGASLEWVRRRGKLPLRRFASANTLQSPEVSDELWMRRALELAAKGRYSTAPNPMVGCVIVRDGHILGEGFHRRAGEPHAEREALSRCSEDPAASTFYITLEPCTHHGRTPPCIDALLAARPARVVIAMRDPNPVVDGRGVAALRSAGIEVTEGVLEEEARRLNERFVINLSERRPFILLKAGMSLDGKLATFTRQSQWITGPEARARSLELREEYDAIVVGSGTVAADDPQLTRRLGLSESILPWTRVVVDTSNALDTRARVLSDGGRTIVFTSAPESLPGVTAEVRSLPAGRDADLKALFEALFESGVRSLIVEGGALLHTSLIEQRLWDKMILFVGPMIIGGEKSPSIFSGAGVSTLADAYALRFADVSMVGADLQITAYRR